MLPEEAVRAALDVNAQVAIPVHWGGFALAFHPWKEPVERFLAEAEKLSLKTTTPNIGQIVKMGHEPVNNSWFKDIE